MLGQGPTPSASALLLTFVPLALYSALRCVSAGHVFSRGALAALQRGCLAPNETTPPRPGLAGPPPASGRDGEQSKKDGGHSIKAGGAGRVRRRGDFGMRLTDRAGAAKQGDQKLLHLPEAEAEADPRPGQPFLPLLPFRLGPFFGAATASRPSPTSWPLSRSIFLLAECVSSVRLRDPTDPAGAPRVAFARIGPLGGLGPLFAAPPQRNGSFLSTERTSDFIEGLPPWLPLRPFQPRPLFMAAR